MKVLKLIVNILRVIIILYLLVYVMVLGIIYVKKTIYKENPPTIIEGYGFTKLESSTFSPDIKKGNYLIYQKTDEFKNGDYIIYRDQRAKTNYIAKINNINKYEYNVLVENKDTLVIEDKDILVKIVYNNDDFSRAFGFLTNPIFLIVLLFIGTILPELLFNK